MGKLLFLSSFLFASTALFAQGTVIFNNRVAGQVDAPVFRPWSITEGAGPNANAQLFLVTGTGAGAVYTPILPATVFHDGSINPLLTRYVVSPGTVQVPGVLPGQSATLVLRMWEGPSYDAASIFGQSAPITITLGGQLPGQPPIPAPALVGLQGFTLVPEPSTIALGLLGAAAFLYRRRR